MDIYYWHKDTALKNFYEAEIGLLKRGLGGDFELLQLRIPDENNSHLIAIGKLKYGEGNIEAIRIIFPTKYPYSSPTVQPVNLISNPDGQIAGVDPIRFPTKQQYNNCDLCLFRKEYWDYHQHNIGFALRRTQEWFKSFKSKEGFKEDQVVEEYPAPLPHKGQVLLPKGLSFAPGVDIVEIALTQFKPNNYILSLNEIQDYPFKLRIGVENFRLFRFPQNLTYKDVFPQFDGQTLLDVFQKYFSEDLLKGENVKNIGFYFPSDKFPFYFFKLQVMNLGNNQVNINGSYLITRIISDELYLRTQKIFSNEILLKKKVTVIGLGAIGSHVSKSLAKNGVGHFNFFDNDIFELGNSVRHAADLFYIGEEKVNVAKQLVQRVNPNITVNAYHQDVLNDSGLLERSLESSDLCVVLTAEDSVDYLINDKYTKAFNIPFVFARASAGAISGSVQVVDKSSACLRCLSSQSLDSLPKSKEKVVYDELAPEFGSCSSPALPGSEIDTNEIALQVSRICLQLLLNNDLDSYSKILGKQFYWHGPNGSDKGKPFEWEIIDAEKYESCEVCS